MQQLPATGLLEVINKGRKNLEAFIIDGTKLWNAYTHTHTHILQMGLTKDILLNGCKVSDVAEGVEDSLRLFIYLCIHVFMQGQGIYPALGLI